MGSPTRKVAVISPMGMTAPTGYKDALSAMGWETICRPVDDWLAVAECVERCGISLILVACRYGTRHFPVELINRHRIPVMIEILPASARGLWDDHDLDIVAGIEQKVVFTPYEPTVHQGGFGEWFDRKYSVRHVPLAVNLRTALPTSVQPRCDVSIMGNFVGREEQLKAWIIPTIQRGMGRWRVEVRGDAAWQHFGIRAAPIPANPAEVFGRSTVSVTLHSPWERDRAAVLNEHAYTIPACGSVAVVDSLLANRVLGDGVRVVSSPSHLCQAVEQLIFQGPLPKDQALKNAGIVTSAHTYLHRLRDLFGLLGMAQEALLAEKAALREAQAFLWKLEAVLEGRE